MEQVFPSADQLPVHDKLPSPLVGENGKKIVSPAEWSKQREYLKGLVSHYMYGEWPGINHKVDGRIIERCEIEGLIVHESVELTVDDSFRFDLQLTYRKDQIPQPAIICNCGGMWQGGKAEYEELSEGYVLAFYNREQIVPDTQLANALKMPVDDRKYASVNCGDIMAWGWGASLTANYLEERGLASGLVVTGHSRGGKAAVCAGIFDERFDVCAPMGSGCGGLGCSRFTGTLNGDRQDPSKCETIGSMTTGMPTWFSSEYAAFGKHDAPHTISELESRLPFDAHTLRALIAPRAIFNSEGTEDYWTNTFGTQLCWQAAEPIFEWLGVPEKNKYYIRKGPHDYSKEDWLALLQFCNQVFGKPAPKFARTLNNPLFNINIADFAE